MASQVDICNKALGYIGAKPIANITEQSAQALRLNAVYATVRDTVLRAADWGFARMIETLAQISGQTVPGWTYLYMSPPLAVRVIMVFTNVDVTNPDPVESEEVRSPTSGQKALACNDSPAYVRYTYQVDDPTLYPADFVTAFALLLAAETAFVLTGKDDMGPRLTNQYMAAISEAKRTNALGKNVEASAENSSSSYESARA